MMADVQNGSGCNWDFWACIVLLPLAWVCVRTLGILLRKRT